MPGVLLTVEHLVVDADDGRRLAFPIGATTLESEVGGLLLSSVDAAGEPVATRLSISEPGLGAALISRVSGKGDDR